MKHKYDYKIAYLFAEWLALLIPIRILETGGDETQRNERYKYCLMSVGLENFLA